MTTYPAVQSIQVVISSEDKLAGGSATNFTVNLQGRLPTNVSEYYVKLLDVNINANDTIATYITDLVSVHVSLGQPAAITSNSLLARDLVGCYNHHSKATSTSTVRVSNPELSQVYVRLRNASDGTHVVVEDSGNNILAITGTVLYLELVPITYDLIAREQVGYKHNTF